MYCIFGVPYGPSLWQVEDSTEQKRTCKINIVKEKHEILTNWIAHMICDMELITTDTIPLINKDRLN